MALIGGVIFLQNTVVTREGTSKRDNRPEYLWKFRSSWFSESELKGREGKGRARGHFAGSSSKVEEGHV